MMKIRNILSIAAVALLAAMAILPLNGVVAATCSTVVVTSANPSGWAFRVTAPNGAGEFVEPAPATPPAGQGAAYLFTGDAGSGGANGDESAQLRNGNYAGTLLSNITTLKYCTYIEQWNGSQAPYIILNVDTDGDGDTEDLLFFEPEYSNGAYNPLIPAQPSPTTNTWQCWDALNGGWYSLNGVNGSGPGANVQEFSDLVAAYPSTARIAAGTGTAGAVRVLVGFASATDVYESYVDAFSIGVSGNCTAFDFEEFDEPSTADQCKNGGWQTFAPPAGPFKNQGQCIQYVNTGK
jgi:hypothetical protein